MPSQSHSTSSDTSAAIESIQVAQSIDAPPTSELTKALIDLLRNVNLEVKSNVVLKGKAAAAVSHYQLIAADLKTLADKP